MSSTRILRRRRTAGSGPVGDGRPAMGVEFLEPRPAFAAVAVPAAQAGSLTQYLLAREPAPGPALAAFACAPSSATHALVYLQRQYASLFGTDLAGRTLADWADTALALAGPGFMNTQPSLGAQKLTSGTVSITPALPLPPVNGIQDMVSNLLTLRYDQYHGELPYRPTAYGETIAFIAGATVLRPSTAALAARASVQLDVGVRRGVPIELTSAQIARASVGAADAGPFIVTATLSGRLQRFDGERWVSIPRGPLSPGRPSFARLAAERQITPGDTVRWIPAAARGRAVPAFRIRGWDGVSATATSSLVSVVPGVAST